MKILFSALLILLNYICISAQENESEAPTFVPSTFRDLNKLPTLLNAETLKPSASKLNFDSFESKRKDSFRASVETVFEIDFDKKVSRFADKNEFSQTKTGEKFRWKPALIQSGIFLGIQHGFRLMQRKTRRELGGKFFRDWGKSIRNFRGWNDGDNAFTNYIAHPLQGGVTGRIFVNNSERASKQEFGKSKIYWESRLKAFAWSVVWSTQFEIGPISEANLGNVGLRQKNGYNTLAWVDLVITPTVGTGVVILEDIFDKYILKNWIEKKIRSNLVIKVLRILFTPTTGAVNVLRGKYPWWRENRPLF